MDELSKLTQRSEEQRRVLLDLQHSVAAAHQDLDSLRADSASAQVRTSVTGPIQVLLQAATAGVHRGPDTSVGAFACNRAIMQYLFGDAGCCASAPALALHIQAAWKGYMILHVSTGRCAGEHGPA